jgi:hypothetical protein
MAKDEKSAELTEDRNYKLVREFLAEVGDCAWSWNVIEEILDKSIAVISGMDCKMTKAFLPNANVRRKIEIFKKLIVMKDCDESVKAEGKKQAAKLEELWDKRSDIIHSRWFTIHTTEDGKVAGIKLSDKDNEQFVRNELSELEKLSNDLYSAYVSLITFARANKFYT